MRAESIDSASTRQTTRRWIPLFLWLAIPLAGLACDSTDDDGAGSAGGTGGGGTGGSAADGGVGGTAGDGGAGGTAGEGGDGGGARPGLPFEVVVAGEYEDAPFDWCPAGVATPEQCCHALSLRSASSREELTAIVDTELAGLEVPDTIDFAQRLAVVAYTAVCPNIGQALVIDRIEVVRRTMLSVDASLRYACTGSTAPSRPYTIFTIERRDVTDLAGELAVVPCDEAEE